MTELIEKKGKKLGPIKGRIVRANQETKDTWTLDIEVREGHLDYLAGQFVSIRPHQFPSLSDTVKYFEHIKGKTEAVRAYSLASAPYEKYLSITIKQEEYEPDRDGFPPLLSPLLASDLLLNKEIELIGYSGAYHMPENLVDSTTTAIHLVAGSGIVPSFSILKQELYKKQNPHIKHYLLYVNKRYEDIIYHQELKTLELENKNQLFIKYFLTREDKNYGPDYFLKRPEISDVRELFSDPESILLFACGPAITKWQKKQAQKNNVELNPRFMEWVHGLVDTLKINKKRYRREVYG